MKAIYEHVSNINYDTLVLSSCSNMKTAKLLDPKTPLLTRKTTEKEDIFRHYSGMVQYFGPIFSLNVNRLSRHLLKVELDLLGNFTCSKFEPFPNNVEKCPFWANFEQKLPFNPKF